MEIPAYAELRCVSNFTFLRGASQPEELVARAKQLGYTALAIADECSLAGIVRAHVAAKEHELKLLVGAQFQVDWGIASSSTTTPFTLTCRGRPNFDHPRRLNIDQGWKAASSAAVCG